MRQAGILARAMRSVRVTVVLVGTVRRQLVLGSGGVPFPLTALPEFEAVERRQAKAVLSAAVRSLRKMRVQADSRFAGGSESVAEAILSEASRIDADLVVVGNEGRGAVRELALGSVALRLLNLSRRPILVVHPPRRRKS